MSALLGDIPYELEPWSHLETFHSTSLRERDLIVRQATAVWSGVFGALAEWSRPQIGAQHARLPAYRHALDVSSCLLYTSDAADE